ncbi:MAG TPA: hypothetical protein VK422_04945, partial [Pyrinomonadaceae bacterium]|nr:hypothetical protein [Pyrinomonadaceae bacterium]
MATKRLPTISALSLILLALSACGGSGDKSEGGEGRGVVVVSAPQAGVVRRVLVNEGAAVGEGDPV